jgi:hypothetical protein
LVVDRLVPALKMPLMFTGRQSPVRFDFKEPREVGTILSKLNSFWQEMTMTREREKISAGLKNFIR